MDNKFDLISNQTKKANNEIFAISYRSSNENQRRSSSASIKSGVDFEKAISEAGCGKFNYLLLMLAFPASCSSNFETTALSYALPTATCDLKLDAYDRGYLNGTIYAGMIMSAFFWGYVSDKFGRQRTLVFGYLGDVLFTVAASLGQDFWTLLVFKFLSGIMICGPFSIFMSYMSELFHGKHRDSVVMAVGLFQSIGGIFQPLIAWAIIPQRISWKLWDTQFVINSWRLFMLVCTLPSLIAGISILFCHESPKFLLAKGRRDEALRVFRSIYSINTGKPENTYSVKKLKFDHLNGVAPKKTFWWEITALFRPPYLQKAMLIFLIQFGCLMSLNTIRLWLPQLFFYIKQTQQKQQTLTTCEILSGNHTIRTADCQNFTVDTSVYTDMLYVNILTTISFSLCTATVRCIGKRNLTVTLFIIQSAMISGLGWVYPPLTSVLAAIFIAISSTTCFGLLGFVVHMFPTTVRTMAVSMTMMFGRIGVCIGNAVFPFSLTLSCPGTFIGFSAISMFCGLALCILAASASTTETDQVPPKTNINK